jgi:hypothetical protein
MDLETLARLGEFVGGFFVVVSLFYLGHQVRQNTRSLRAENYARVLDRLSTLQSNLSSDRELNRIVTVGARNPESLTAEERTRMTWALFELLGATEFVFHQAEDRALPDPVWARWEATLAWWVSHPGVQLWWRSRPSPFTPAFERLVDGLIENSPVDQDALRRWRRFVDGPESRPRAEAREGEAAQT